MKEKEKKGLKRDRSNGAEEKRMGKRLGQQGLEAVEEKEKEGRG